jgi:hypothetical protein
MTRKNAVLAGMILALLPNAARPEVVDSSANGFTVKMTLNIQASPGDVYLRLVRDIGDWWNPAHTFSGSAHNMSIDEKPLGCFCEKLPNQGGVRHMEVLFVAPGKNIVMSGAIGPMQSLAATGTMNIELSKVDAGTKLDVKYAAAGYFPKGMNLFAAPSDNVLTEQFTRLKNYIESGNPAPK